MLTTPERPETSVHALLASPVALLLVTTLAAAGSPLPAQGPPAHAQPAEASSLQSQPLRFSWTRDGALTAG